MQTTNRFTRRVGIAGVGLPGAAGVVTMMVAGAGGASAAGPVSGGTGPNTNQVTASVTVPSVTTLTLNNNTLAFNSPASLPGAATNGPLTVTGLATTNDQSGYTVSVYADTSGFVDGGTPSASFPSTALSYEGTGGGSFSPLSPGPGNSSTIDNSPVAASNPISDAWNLQVPNTTPGAYTMNIDYGIVGN